VIVPVDEAAALPDEAAGLLGVVDELDDALLEQPATATAASPAAMRVKWRIMNS
jgi:hypothetical protein